MDGFDILISQINTCKDAILDDQALHLRKAQVRVQVADFRVTGLTALYKNTAIESSQVRQFHNNIAMIDNCIRLNYFDFAVQTVLEMEKFLEKCNVKVEPGDLG